MAVPPVTDPFLSQLHYNQVTNSVTAPTYIIPNSKDLEVSTIPGLKLNEEMEMTMMEWLLKGIILWLSFDLILISTFWYLTVTIKQLWPGWWKEVIVDDLAEPDFYRR